MLNIRTRINELKNQTPHVIQANEQHLNALINGMKQDQDRHYELFIVGLTEIKRLSTEYIRAEDAENGEAFNDAFTLNHEDQNRRVQNAHPDNIVKYLRDEIERGAQTFDDLGGEKVGQQATIRTCKRRVKEIKDDLNRLKSEIKNLNQSLEKMEQYTRRLEKEIEDQQLLDPDFDSRRRKYLYWLNQKRLHVIEILEKSYM